MLQAVNCRLKPILTLGLILCLCFWSSLATAQLPPVATGFPNNHTCTPGQLLFRQVGLERVTVIAHHNGRIYSDNVAGSARREWLFGNLSDPASLAIVNTSNLPPFVDHGTHGYMKAGDYLGGGGFMHYRRVSPGVNNNQAENPESFGLVQTWPAGGSLHYVYWPWAMPFNWIQYGPNAGTARLWRADRLLAEWQPLADHGVAGNSILLGNLLFVTSDASMLGILVYDIAPTLRSPPEPPELLDKFTGPVGAYIASLWENYLVLAGGVDQDQLFIIDYSDPTDLQLVRTLDLRGNSALNAGSNVPYVQKQDQYVFTRRHKIDMERMELVLELDEVGNQRPAGSVSGQLDTSQFMLPLGNLLLTGSYSSPGRDGVGVWCHQATPDRRAPYVGYHIPRPGQTGYPTGAPVSLVIAEALESYTIVNGQSILLRPLGGQPVDAWTSFSYDGVLTLTPRQDLLPDTTYELVIPAGGIRDAAGNGIEPLSFTFSTGDALGGGNASPQIHSFAAQPAPAAPGQPVQFTVSASDADGDPLQYRFLFGDGSAPTAWAASSSVSHSYAASGHYPAKVQVRDVRPDGSHAVSSRSMTLAVAPLPPPPLPTQSSQLALDAGGRQLWVVDPDNDRLTRVGADSRLVELEIDLVQRSGLAPPLTPVGVAVAAAGEVWVALRDADHVLVLSPSGTLLASIATGHGSAPQALVASRDGTRVYLSLAGRASSSPGHGQVLRFEAASRSESGRLALGPSPRAMALRGDGSRLFVARFLSTEHFGEVWEVDPQTMTLLRTLPLWRDRGVCGPDAGGSDGPGVPNYVSSLVLSPQQDWLWYGAVKADTNRGGFFTQDYNFNTPLAHDSTLRALLGRLNLQAAGGVPVEPGRDNCGSARGRVDIDNADSPSALAFSTRGDYVFVAQQGNDTVSVFDDLAIRAGAGRSSVWRLPVGEAPQALLWDPATDTLWSRNLMGRSVTALALGDFVAVGRRELQAQTVQTSSQEKLAPAVRAGKRHFYFAGNRSDGQNEMSFEGYLSCASCHLDGGQDGRIWDFTQRGEGLRNTTDLRGRGGMAHGNVHWSGNFDEIQDFVNDIVLQFRGRGFLPPGATPNPPLGAPNAGRSVELDELAAYVASLDSSHLPRSPWRMADGSLGAQAQAGQAVFAALGCGGCHLPERDYTDSALGTALLHDVGTLRTSSGSRLGGPLPGIDTPTLLGLWDSAPYFHDGSALTLEDVFRVAGGRIYEAEAQCPSGQTCQTHAVLAGGAVLPGFPQFNEDSSFHGHMVSLPQNGARVTFHGVDGGGGGMGAVELRWMPAAPALLRITVNGSHVQERNVAGEQTHFEWRRVRFEDVPLLPGSSNQIEVRRVSTGSWQSPGLDHITVSRPEELALAAAHRVALTASSSDREALMAWLRSLDALNASAGGPPDGIHADGFEEP